MDAVVKLAGITLRCRDVSDQWRSAIARHQYPGHSGADLENLGWGPSEHRLRTVFLGDQGASDWETIKTKLRTGASLELEHPTEGTLSGLVESLTATHDNRRNCVEVEFSFVVDGVDKPPSIRPSAAAVATGSAQKMVDIAIETVAAQFGNAAIPSPDLTDSNWLEKLGDLGNATNALVRKLQTGIRYLDGTIASVTNPVSAALNALEFGAELPGQLALRLATVMDLMQGKVAGSPSASAVAHKFLRDLKSLISTFRNTPSEGAVRILAASQAAQTIANLMATDEDRLRAMQAYEQEAAFDDSGRWVGKAAAPKTTPASVTQIANLVSASREIIQSARPFANEPALLDTLAVALQDQYRDRLIRFESVREIVILNPTPLHMICHANGLPYNAAERVALLNPQIKNPTFTQGRILIYAP